MKYQLKFECGAEYAPQKRSFAEYCKVHKLGRTRHDGRQRIAVFDTNGGITVPKMPDGTCAPCLSCPCKKSAGRRETKAMSERAGHGRRIVVTCYPEEVKIDERTGI